MSLQEDCQTRPEGRVFCFRVYDGTLAQDREQTFQLCHTDAGNACPVPFLKLGHEIRRRASASNRQGTLPGMSLSDMKCRDAIAKGRVGMTGWELSLYPCHSGARSEPGRSRGWEPTSQKHTISSTSSLQEPRSCNPSPEVSDRM